MAIRNIVTEGDSVLAKKCHQIVKFDDRLAMLIDDMKETLEQANGVGLAAPQVGVLRRVVVINIPELDVELELVNPEIIEQSGVQEEMEGCLSCPNEWGITSRPMFVTVKAYDRNGEEFTVKGEGLLARCLCHELDHLDGVLFKERTIRMLDESDFALGD
ncbi:MAG: peptide deformylase [Acutalibacteraceae bacterium]|nr:peptide deformylase [Acutalibacteraceae bacterium]